MYSWDLLYESDIADLRALLSGEEPEFDDYASFVSADTLVAEQALDRFEQFARDVKRHYPIETDQEAFEQLVHAHLLRRDESVAAHPQYEASPNQLLRATEILLTSNGEVVRRASVSECQLVRAAARLNAHEPDGVDSSLRVEEEDFEPCDCAPADVSMRETLRYYKLVCPDVGSFLGRLRQRGRLSWSTHATPTSFDDYRFHEVAAEYLKGPVPDQFALSHDGHGVNSYALTARFAAGDLACIVQIGYGGAYGDAEEDRKTWSDAVELLNDLRAAAELSRAASGGDVAAGAPQQRKLLLAFSDLRMESGVPVLHEFRDGEWHGVPLGSVSDQPEFPRILALGAAALRVLERLSN